MELTLKGHLSITCVRVHTHTPHTRTHTHETLYIRHDHRTPVQQSAF